MKLALQAGLRNFLSYLEMTRIELTPQAQASLDGLVTASEFDS
jgi:hypothetical protein